MGGGGKKAKQANQANKKKITKQNITKEHPTNKKAPNQTKENTLLHVIILQEHNCWHGATKDTAAEGQNHMKSQAPIDCQTRVITCALVALFFWGPKGT